MKDFRNLGLRGRVKIVKTIDLTLYNVNSHFQKFYPALNRPFSILGIIYGIFCIIIVRWVLSFFVPMFCNTAIEIWSLPFIHFLANVLTAHNPAGSGWYIFLPGYGYYSYLHRNKHMLFTPFLYCANHHSRMGIPIEIWVSDFVHFGLLFLMYQMIHLSMVFLPKHHTKWA